MVPVLGHPVYTNEMSNVGYITDTGVTYIRTISSAIVVCADINFAKNISLL